ncbi:MAG: metallophosphoesterase family protein [Halanaerobiaceae bacterium]
MKENIRFIHAADIHLGSILHIGDELPGHLQEVAKKASLNAFKNICDTAIKSRVDFVLLAGDVYDQEARSVMANRYFNKQCQRLSEENIPVYMIGGNHDPLGNNNIPLDIPENVHLFNDDKPEIKEVTDKNNNVRARIIGQSYQKKAESTNISKAYKIDDKHYWNIAMLHTQLDPNNKKYVPCSLTDLIQIDNIDYWALGHVHKFNIVYNNNNKVVSYPGITQGRDIGEQGLKGAVLVELSNLNDPIINFVPTADVIWKKLEYNVVENISNLTDLKEKIIENIESFIKNKHTDINNAHIAEDQYWSDTFKGYVLRIILSGRTEINKVLKEQGEEALQYLKEQICNQFQCQEPFLWVDKIIDRTGKPLPNIEELSQKNNVFSDIIKMVDKCKEDISIKKELLDEFGTIWSESIEESNRDYLKFELSQERLDIILNQAQQLIFEELLSGGETNDH